MTYQIDVPLKNGGRMMQRYCLSGRPIVETPRMIKYSEGEYVAYTDHLAECERLRQVLRIIATDLEYPCEINDVGEDGLCQCTCCKWVRLARAVLYVKTEK